MLLFFEKIFLYGSLLWLLAIISRSLRFSLIFCVVLLSGIEIMQMFIPGRTAEITDPVLAVILGVFFYFLDLRDKSNN
jgi:VanZ family protein